MYRLCTNSGQATTKGACSEFVILPQMVCDPVLQFFQDEDFRLYVNFGLWQSHNECTCS